MISSQQSDLARDDEATLDIASLFLEHGAAVARWAARLGGPGIDVEDVVQEVFLVAGRRLPHFDGRARVTTWLFRATERVVMSARRKARLRRQLARLPAVFGRTLAAEVPGPDRGLDRREAAGLVYGILDRLPTNQRKVLILFQMEGLSTEQIAELVQVKPATVRVWLHRARARFVELYQASERQGARAYQRPQEET